MNTGAIQHCPKTVPAQGANLYDLRSCLGSCWHVDMCPAHQAWMKQSQSEAAAACADALEQKYSIRSLQGVALR